jgi:preprotein translocase SecE subunit
MKSKGTWVAIFFIAATLLVGYVLHLAFAETFVWLAVIDQPVMGPKFTLSALCGLSLAVLIGLYTGLVNQRSRSYITEVVSEIDKVAWPTLLETRNATFTVIVTCCIAAVILGIFDTLFGWLSRNNLFLF